MHYGNKKTVCIYKVIIKKIKTLVLLEGAWFINGWTTDLLGLLCESSGHYKLNVSQIFLHSNFQQNLVHAYSFFLFFLQFPSNKLILKKEKKRKDI